MVKGIYILTTKNNIMTKLINQKINASNHERLKNFSDGTIDKNLNLLMDQVEKIMPFVNFSEEMKSINVYSDTIERLDGFHLTGSESRDNIITRLFIAFDEIDAISDEYWIPFKLTSVLNKKLIIAGQVEYYSKDILFNEGSKPIGYELPKTYVFDGEDLSPEYNSWQKLLNWNEISGLILDNKDSKKTIIKTNYVLDINYI